MSPSSFTSLRKAMRRRTTIVTAVVASLALLAGAAVYILPAVFVPQEPPTLAQPDPVGGRDGIVRPWGEGVGAYAAGPPEVSWPQAARVDVPVTDHATTVDVGGLPLTVTPVSGEVSPGTVTVETFDQAASKAAGVSGVLLKVTGQQAGRISLSTGYGSFAGGYGGSYGDRLALWQLPDCTAANGAVCPRTAGRVNGVNDGEAKTVSATVDAVPQGVVMALAAADSSAQGSYKATALAVSSSWSHSGSSGGFNWSYPIETPPVPGGLAPTVSLSYSSQGVDGRTAVTNNQGSWIGEGFTFEPGYIERRYKPCSDDGHDTSAEQCWAWDNATLMLDGKSSGQLVKDGATWKISSDDGSKVERITDTTVNNGDNDGEYWKVTTPDGTQYYFGLNRLPGWASGNDETDSTWTTPVFGDDSGEPCYKSTFEDAHCDQAWRWNLDYVIDPKGNATAFFYGKETNYYALNAKTDVNGTGYTRSGWLKRIEYGHRAGAVYATPAPARVLFTTAERCLPTETFDCDPAKLNETNASYWPDVPFDRVCKAGTTCEATQVSATFFTRKRLVSIETQIRGASGWSGVDRWDLGHDLVSNADTTRTLWLRSITRTGLAGGADPITLPSTLLVPVQKPNRIDVTGDSISPLIRPRLATVYTDTGGQVDVMYSGEDCTPTDEPSEKSNTRRCYPVKWQPGSYSDKITDWFHKYVVTQVTVSDNIAETPDQVSSYEYHGAAWRKPDPDGIGKTEDLTWADWRGYRTVDMYMAKGTTLEAHSATTYFQGMDGDDDGNGGTRVVQLTDSEQGTHTDYDELSGKPLEAIVDNDGAIVTKAISTYEHTITKTDTHSWGEVRASRVLPDVNRSLTALESGAWRETTIDQDYDTRGRLVSTDDHGDVTTSADDQCTRVEYADNPDKYMYSYVKRTEVLAVKCADVATVDRFTQVIGDNRTSFDGLAYGAAPVNGLATLSEELSEHDGTTATYVTTATVGYDAYGRATTSTDANGHSSSIAYTDTFGLATQMVSTNAKGHQTVTTVDPTSGQAVSVVDANGEKTEFAFDALRRLTSVWAPNRDRSRGQSPSNRFSYHIRTDGPIAVTTEKLDNSLTTYSLSVELLDSQLKTRQTQAEGPDGGRLITDTVYDALGRVAQTNDVYYTTGAPQETLFVPVDGDLNGSTITVFDDLSRPVASIFAVAGVEKWRTTTSYGGDRTDTTPPAGGVPTTAITDARGKTTELRQYHGTTPTGDFDPITYTYTPKGQLQTVTDAAGSTWTSAYDQRGRKARFSGPDAGISDYAYDPVGNLTSTITYPQGNPNNPDTTKSVLSYGYDELDRRTDTWDGPAGTGTLLSHWYFDTRRKGQLTATRSYQGDVTVTSSILAYDYAYRPTNTSYSMSSTSGTTLGAFDGGRWEFSTNYNTDGTISSQGYPAAGGLSSEVVSYTYDALHRPTKVTSINKTLADQIGYYPTGELGSVTLPAGPSPVYRAFEYEDGTKRLARSLATAQMETGSISDTRYTYDAAGNVKSIIDDPTVQGGQRDAQCFTYDWLRRLTQAWTTAQPGSDETACTGGPAATGVDTSSTAAYQYTYGFNGASGNRVSLEVAATGAPGSPTADVTTNYTYGKPDGTAPHTLARTESSTSGTIGQNVYTYDALGNTTSVDRDGNLDILNWDKQNHLATIQQGDKTTRYIYDADGNRIATISPDGNHAHLPGMELEVQPATGGVFATRYITLPDGTTHVTTSKGAGSQYQLTDPHGTGTIAINNLDNTITHRYTDPYGNPRGTPPGDGTWYGNRGFIGGISDPTGYTHLGAREYDPVTGRFISVDPLIDLTDPQQMNGYAYAGNNPTTMTDPTGLMLQNPIDKGGPRTAFVVLPNGTWVGHNIGSGEMIIDGVKVPVNPADPAAFAAEYDRLVGGEWKGSTDPTLIMWKACGNLGPDGGCSIDVEKALFGLYHDTNIDAWIMNEGGMGAGLIGMMFTGGRGLMPGRKDPKTGAPKGPCRNSFTGDTPVLLADDTSKPIKDIHEGDHVTAGDPATGQTSTQTVTATIAHSADQLLTITIDTNRDGHSDATITTTPQHPFWLTSKTAWTTADHLQPGDRLQTPNRSTATITNITTLTRDVTVHNLTISNLHTYYVLAGYVPVLVHNGGGDPVDLTGKSMNVWQEGPYRIDIEGSPSGVQMHFQIQINGVKSSEAPKYHFNPATGEFDGMPNSLKKTLAKKFPNFKKALAKGIDIFGRAQAGSKGCL